MVVSNYVDGDILTAGSLNNSVNARQTFVRFNGSSYNTGDSGTNITIRDEYITSGILASINQILVMTNWEVSTAEATNQSAHLRIYAGPSGTSPTLTLLGSFATTVNADTAAITYSSITGIGSTTVDSASVPALVRITAGVTHASLSTTLLQTMIFGVQ